MAVSDTGSAGRTVTYTRLKGQWVWFGRAVWGICAAVIIVAFLFAVPIRFHTVNTACNADCATVQISETGVRNLQESLGLSLSGYAIVIVSKEVLLSLVYIIAGVVLYSRRSDDWLVIIISLTLMIAGPTMSVFNVLDNTLVFIQAIGFSLMLLLIFFFPNGQFVPSWTRIPVILATIIQVVLLMTVSLLNVFVSMYFIFLIFAGFLSQVYRYRRIATQLERQQTKWIVFGFGSVVFGIFMLLSPAMIFPAYLTPLEQPTVTLADFVYRAILGYVGFSFMGVLPIVLAISTLRYRLWDADPIINRGLVYGAMTVGSFVILFVTTYVIQFVFGEQRPLVAIVIAVLFCGLTFNYARKRIQHWVDRYVYGLRFDLHELESAQRQVSIDNPGALTGKVIDGYEIEGVLGKGGMGEVYKGFGNNEQVAVKTMLPEIAKDKTMQTRFQREADIGKTLRHPNIAKVYSSGIVDDTPCLIMEYVEGVELGSLLKQNGPLDIETTGQIFHDICSALDFAHQHGYVHRDIKPSNIMIRENGSAVLMDFGITKMQDTTSALTGTGMVGTIDYMAPEQITAAKEIDHRADIYSLGVMLFEMLTGQKPFKGGPAQVMFAHLQQPAPDPQDIVPSIRNALADVVLCAMAKDPEERFDSAGALASALMR